MRYTTKIVVVTAPNGKKFEAYYDESRQIVFCTSYTREYLIAKDYQIAEKEEALRNFEKEEDNASKADPLQRWQIDYIWKIFEKINEEHGYFKRSELESWLYEIAFNNIDGSKTDRKFAEACEEIIKRLDGFERYVKDKRKEEHHENRSNNSL